MQKAKVTELSINQCKKSYEKTRLVFADSQLCALNLVKTADTCQGDSGGPLQLFKDDQYFIVGITSFGIGCGSSLPGIYTRVNSFIDWIEKRIWVN